MSQIFCRTNVNRLIKICVRNRHGHGPDHWVNTKFNNQNYYKQLCY